MATAEWAQAQTNTNDADFRLWGSTLSTKLQSLPGLTKTSDTGQVNWLTVTRPGAGSYVNEFYYLNDSLHGTYPIYFQIKYGSSAYSINAPFVQISVGTGTNGTGTLTTASAGGGMFQPSAGTATPLLNFISAGEGYLTMIIAIGIPNGASAPALAMYHFSRFCDDSGSPITGGGILYLVDGSTTTTRHVLRSSTWNTDGNEWGTRISSSYATSIYNNLPQIMPDFIHQTPKFRFNPNAVGYLSSEYANYVAFRATPMGVTERQYITFGSRANADVFRQAYRYE